MNSIINNRQKIKVNYKMNFDGGNLSFDLGFILFEKFIENFNLKKLVEKSMDFNNRNSIFLAKLLEKAFENYYFRYRFHWN